MPLYKSLFKKFYSVLFTFGSSKCNIVVIARAVLVHYCSGLCILWVHCTFLHIHVGENVLHVLYMFGIPMRN